jgi:hypothetical protein
MEITTLQNMLVSMDIPENTWTSDKELYLVNLPSDGNHYNHYYEQMLYFDTINGILKIKFYKFRLASSKFFSVEQIGNTNFKIKHDTFAYYGIDERKDLDKLRNPKIGDYAYTIDSAGNFVAASKIVALTESTMEVEADLVISAGERLCYADGTVLVPGVTMFNPINSVDILESLANDSQILYRKPKTIYTADDYIFVDNINGFSLIRY